MEDLPLSYGFDIFPVETPNLISPIRDTVRSYMNSLTPDTLSLLSDDENQLSSNLPTDLPLMNIILTEKSKIKLRRK